MPLAVPARPRKMLPPPITMQIWLPASAASFPSRAMRSTVAISMPKAPSPISASPDTFSSTRRYFGIAVIRPPLPSTLPWREGRNLSERREGRFRRGATTRSPHLSPYVSARARHLGDFAGEIAFDFLDAFAHLEADKAFDRHRRAQFLAGLLQHLAHLGFPVDHKGLRQQ